MSVGAPASTCALCSIGGATGVADTSVLHGPAPAALTARTRTVYSVSLVALMVSVTAATSERFTVTKTAAVLSCTS